MMRWTNDLSWLWKLRGHMMVIRNEMWYELRGLWNEITKWTKYTYKIKWVHIKYDVEREYEMETL